MTEYKIDPNCWFGERELKHTPKHFVVAKTPLTPQGKLWILTKLKGRFSVTYAENDFEDFFLLNMMGNPAFEDPKEAVFYELTWS